MHIKPDSGTPAGKVTALPSEFVRNHKVMTNPIRASKQPQAVFTVMENDVLTQERIIDHVRWTYV